MVDAPLFGLPSWSQPTGEDVLNNAPVLPTRRHADQLMEIYWRCLNPLIPILDQDVTSELYRDLYSGSAATDPDEKVLIGTLNVVFALSTQLQEHIPPEQREHIPPEQREHIPPEQREQASSIYFNRAWNLVKPESTLWTPGSLEIVQYLLLLSEYLQCTNRPHQTWMIVGLAVRVAQSLKLYVPATDLASASRQCFRTRIWQCCLFLDRYVIMSQS
jgi:hypothetical protein